MNLFYTYGGRVESNKDPLKLGRLKVRVPHIYGATGSGSGFVATNDLPWAMPAGLPAGGSSASGGLSQLPAIGDKVWVRFLDGEPEKPIWEWGMQSLDDADTLKLHSYATQTDGSVGPPDRTVWTRNSHALEINAGGIIASTSGGYRLLLNDSATPASFDGSVTISTSLGNSISLDDLTQTIQLVGLQDVNFQIANSFLAMSFDYSWLTAADYSVEAAGAISMTSAGLIELTTPGDFIVDALTNVSMAAGTTFDLISGAVMTLDSLTIFLGKAATEPIVLGGQLTALITALITYLDTHTHTSATSGSPTSPPIVPSSTTLTPLVPGIVSQVAFVK